MRNPLPVLAAALLTAVASYAGTPLAFKRADWSVVEPNVSRADIDTAVKKTCAGGTLVAAKASVSERSQSLCKNSGFLCRIPLVCVVMNTDGTATQSPVDATVLELKVTGMFGADPRYWLFAGPGQGVQAVVREPSAAELIAPAPEPKKPLPKKPEPKKPEPKKPEPKQPAPPAGAHAQVPLSLMETYWLAPDERKAYTDAIDASKKPNKAAKQAAYKKGRDTVAKNLRDELQAPYAKLVADGQFDQIDALLMNKNWAVFDTYLHDEEYEALKKVLRTPTAHSDFKQANAALEYDAEMKPIVGADGKPKQTEFVLAHRITVKYRAMVPPKTGTPPPAVDPFAPLTDADFARIPDEAKRKDVHDKYNEAWKAADTNEKKAKLNKDTLAEIEKLAAEAKPKPKPGASMKDLSAIKTDAELSALSPEDQKKFCAMSSGEGAAASCGDMLGATSNAMTDCMKNNKEKDRAKAQLQCLETIHPECKGSPTGTVTRTPLANLPKPMQTHCAQILSPGDEHHTGTGTGTGSAINNSPCPGAKGKDKDKAGAKPTDGASAGGASDHVGKDEDPCKKDDDKGPDPNFYTNLGMGLSFGVGGLLLASFFGGPALMLAVAVTAGIGGYYFAKANDEPKKKK